MKLRLTLLTFCLLGIGIFSDAQGVKKALRKPPPPPVVRDGKKPPPPKIEVVHFAAPKVARPPVKPAVPPKPEKLPSA